MDSVQELSKPLGSSWVVPARALVVQNHGGPTYLFYGLCEEGEIESVTNSPWDIYTVKVTE